MIRTIYFYLCFVLSLLFSSIYRIKIRILTNKGDIKKRTEYIHKVSHSWAKFIMKAAGAKINIIGLENIPKNQTVLFVSNHQSNFDIPLLLGVIDVPKGFIAKKELENWPIISTWMKYINCIFMDRDNLRKSAESIVEGVNLLKSGYSMVIFPSGHRSKGKSIDEFKGGSFKLATKSKCPIVPITINGTYKLLEENNNRIKGATIELIIHTPINVSNLNKEELDNLPNTVHSTIINAL
ncbi:MULTISPECIES: lysophospholipid acyltransferase family protein [unclassified Clostridium]|uniref:lysophospholipid acyltransferase family protein n=1 Tax=unclassified Clostridium TaxID=2614128 RepID=UPI0002980FA2|nr:MULTISPECIES: lysophospholipid acyltransferase family protein [unclassified Clostridium]EKQ57805.1 MAG: 1-acyl-sn-glycerol-3-phosphate acyltransferase [Clostridium sp. Maddingley MBC34-26]